MSGAVDVGRSMELQGFDAFGSSDFDLNLKRNLFGKIFQLPFVFNILLISCFMFKHSFSSSEMRYLMSSTATIWSWPFLAWIWASFLVSARFPLAFCEFSRLSDTNNQPVMEVRRRSCSKNRTWTITRRGSLSFWAACVLASRESFWQFISRQICSLSESVSQGCAWNWEKHQCFTLKKWESSLKKLTYNGNSGIQLCWDDW